MLKPNTWMNFKGSDFIYKLRHPVHDFDKRSFECSHWKGRGRVWSQRYTPEYKMLFVSLGWVFYLRFFGQEVLTSSGFQGWSFGCICCITKGIKRRWGLNASSLSVLKSYFNQMEWQTVIWLCMFPEGSTSPVTIATQYTLVIWRWTNLNKRAKKCNLSSRWQR